MEKLTYLEIPGNWNSRREFEDARFPGILGGPVENQCLFLCLDIVVIETPDTYNLTYIDDYGVHAAHGDNLLFKVRAKTDAHVALTRYHFTVSAMLLMVAPPSESKF